MSPRTLLLLASLAVACSEPAPMTPPADAAAAPDALADAAPPDAPAPDVPLPDAPPPDAPTRPPLTLTWGPCDSFSGQDNPSARCADVDVPLDWSDPAGERITLHVRHLPARTASGRSLWILLGGPGQGGAGGEGVATVLAQRDPGLDVFIPDHRGTGRSNYLSCPTPEAWDSPGGPSILPDEWPRCRDEIAAEWGTRLRHFSSTAAARDLIALIDAVPRPRTYVLGISYGTWLANRYLQLAPAQAQGVIFDSDCPPGECVLSRHDEREDAVIRAMLARCAAEPECARRLGPDPVARLRDLHRRVAEGHCSLAPTAAQRTWLLRSAIGHMAFHAVRRRLIPALIHRMDRCDGADRAAISTLYRVVLGEQWLAASQLLAPWTPPLGMGGEGAGEVGYSLPLGVNILVGELWETPAPTATELVRRWSETLGCRGVGRHAAAWTAGWPRYEEPLAGRAAESDVPMLVLNAEFDPATPAEYARLGARRLRGPHQRYVEIPGAAHTTVAQGALADDTSTTCGRELALQFLRDPRATLDTSCLARTIPLAFAASPQLAMQVLGTPSLWGDP
jgi:pimeloyl-ACP methyl ester carboxylesterase